MPIITQYPIGDYPFAYNSSFSLYAFKDGTFHILKEIYDQDPVTDDDILSCWRIHQWFDQSGYKKLINSLWKEKYGEATKVTKNPMDSGTYYRPASRGPIGRHFPGI